MSIREITRKIKGKAKKWATYELAVALIIIFVGVSSFGLGRLSALENEQFDVYIENPSDTQLEGMAIEALENEGKYVGSKNGSSYHLPWCPGAQRILPKNQIWFDTIEEAENAGYNPAGNCKGL